MGLKMLGGELGKRKIMYLYIKILLYMCCRHVRAEGKASVEDRTRVEGETKAEKQK